MSTKFVQDGHKMEWVNGTGVAVVSGQVVQVGNLVGVAQVDIAIAGSGTVHFEGVHSLAKVGSQAWAQGDPVFWDHTNLYFTKTASSDADTLAGFAFEAVGSGAGETTGKVLLVPSVGKKAATVAALAQTISGTYSQSEVQAISTKVDAILSALKAAGLMDS